MAVSLVKLSFDGGNAVEVYRVVLMRRGRRQLKPYVTLRMRPWRKS